MKALFPLMIVICLLLVACQPKITSFEECVEAGNPVMESYPRQCATNGQTFVEELPQTEQPPEPLSFTECTERTEFCTLEYAPVCGLIDNGIRCIRAPCASTDADTYGNGCGACSAGAAGYYRGTCEEQRFIVCAGDTVTGFDPEQVAEDSGGICVDICPGNYDGYITQIGVEMCIRHYGADDIASWETCGRSSDGCDCVRTYETTSGEQIDDAAYRCVPEQYAERLLFRGGVDRLDEDGVSGVAIA